MRIIGADDEYIPANASYGQHHILCRVLHDLLGITTHQLIRIMLAHCWRYVISTLLSSSGVQSINQSIKQSINQSLHTSAPWMGHLNREFKWLLCVPFQKEK